MPFCLPCCRVCVHVVQVPRENVEFVIRSLGGQVGWEGPGSAFDASDDAITHVVTDRPGLVRRLVACSPISLAVAPPLTCGLCMCSGTPLLCCSVKEINGGRTRVRAATVGVRQRERPYLAACPQVRSECRASGTYCLWGVPGILGAMNVCMSCLAMCALTTTRFSLLLLFCAAPPLSVRGRHA